MKRKTQLGVDLPDSHFELAEAVAAFYDTEWGIAAVARFRKDSAFYRIRLRNRTQLDWMTYVMRLVMTCPVLLTCPPGLAGLEWVFEDFCWIVRHRGVSPRVDQGFWRAIEGGRARLPKGHHITKGRDTVRYQLVYARMNPVTTDPLKGLVRVQGMSKSEAVAHQAEWEQKQSKSPVSERTIYRYLEQVEKYLQKMREQFTEEGPN